MAADERAFVESPAPAVPAPLSIAGRLLILATAFLGWLFAGLLIQTTSLAMRAAAIDLLARGGVLDLPRFQALNKIVLEHKNDPAGAAALSAGDAALQKSWEELV